MYNWSFLFVVLHKPTLLPSTFKPTPNPILKSIGMVIVQRVVVLIGVKYGAY